MIRILAACCMLAGMPLGAAEIQGYLADWQCVKKIVKDGAEQTFKNDKNCRLDDNYNRRAYGLITDDKKYYRMDDAGNQQARQLLLKSPGKNQLRVIVKGDVTGNTIRVQDMSIL